MAEAISPMEIDDENNNLDSLKTQSKGKSVVVLTAPPDMKATPWVEKYRPQSLDDVAAHRDIVETSKLPPYPSLSVHFLLICLIYFLHCVEVFVGISWYQPTCSIVIRLEVFRFPCILCSSILSHCLPLHFIG